MTHPKSYGLIKQGMVLFDNLHNNTLIVKDILSHYYCGNGNYILLQYLTTNEQVIMEYDRIRDRIINGMFIIK